MDDSLREIIAASVVTVAGGRYAYLKADAAPARPCFLVARDADEITVVCEEAELPEIPHSRAEKWFKLLEIRVSRPFAAKGFLASVSAAVAGRGLNILVVSTFSKDYALVREEDCREAADALAGIGFPVIWRGGRP